MCDREAKQAAAVDAAAVVQGLQVGPPARPLGGLVGALAVGGVEALVPPQTDLMALGRGRDDGAGEVLGATVGVAADDDAELGEQELERAALGVRAREVVGAERVG